MDTIAVKAAIKDALVTAGAENVYTVEPKLEDISDMLDRVMQLDREFLQYWVIRRVSGIPETSDTMPGFIPIGCVVRWMQRFVIELYVAYQEADEDREASLDRFDKIADQTLTAMAENRTLDGVGWNMFRPMALLDVRDDRLGEQFLCHHGVFAIELIDDQEVHPH